MSKLKVHLLRQYDHVVIGLLHQGALKHVLEHPDCMQRNATIMQSADNSGTC